MVFDSHAAHDLSRLDIMVVDDDRHMRHMLRAMLSNLGVKTLRLAPDPAEALSILRRNRVDLIITDLVMNPIDGIEFVHLLRTAPDTPNALVPVIVLSGYTEMGRIFHARDAGINEFLAKPVTAHALYARIAAVIDRPRDFVYSFDFVGPDRRRIPPPENAPRRRADDAADEIAIVDAALADDSTTAPAMFPKVRATFS